MEKVHVVLVMTLLKMLQVLVLLTVHHLILITKKENFLVLGERQTNGINDREEKYSP